MQINIDMSAVNYCYGMPIDDDSGKYWLIVFAMQGSNLRLRYNTEIEFTKAAKVFNAQLRGF